MSGETGQVESGWTTDTLREHLQGQVDDLKRLLDERYAVQNKAVDAAFSAQQLAMQTALTSAERAVQAALAAAEKAVIKAETAADKRFEAVNEFRSQLADQQNTFISRSEALAATERNTERINDLTDRINRSEGKGAGLSAGWVYLLGAMAAIGTIVSIYLVVRG